MIREFSATGITADVSFFPNPGYKYRLMFAGIQLITGTGTGTRSAYLQRQASISETYADTGGRTTASSTYTATGSVVPYGGNVSFGWYDYPEIDATSGMQLAVSLVAGDTVSYTIIVDEVIDA